MVWFSLFTYKVQSMNLPRGAEGLSRDPIFSSRGKSGTVLPCRNWQDLQDD